MPLLFHSSMVSHVVAVIPCFYFLFLSFICFISGKTDLAEHLTKIDHKNPLLSLEALGAKSTKEGEL